MRQRQIRQSPPGAKSSVREGDIVHGPSPISNVQSRYGSGDNGHEPRPGQHETCDGPGGPPSANPEWQGLRNLEGVGDAGQSYHMPGDWAAFDLV